MRIYSLVNIDIYSTYCSTVCSVCSFPNLYWCSPKLFLITEVPEWAEVPQKKRWMLCLFYRYIIVFTAHWRLHFVHCLYLVWPLMLCLNSVYFNLNHLKVNWFSFSFILTIFRESTEFLEKRLKWSYVEWFLLVEQLKYKYGIL